jgi:FtsH-binding integral membrane protein
MNNFNNVQSSVGNLSDAQVDEGLRTHMLRVYNYMSAALALTGIVAWFSATSGLYVAIANTMLIYVVMFAPLGVVFYFASKINTMTVSRAQSVFWFFAGLMGLSLSYIFLAYTGTAVFQAFFVTAGAFASLSLWGYTTKKNLSAMGGFLVMGLFGLIIASVVNLFVGSGQLSFLINIFGVLIFAGLTAWDTQKIKRDWLNRVQYGSSEAAEKSAIMGSLTLYLDFINLFLFMLRFMGGNRN